MNNLKVVRPQTINPDEVFAFAKDMASRSQKLYADAEDYMCFMKNQHESFIQLMAEAESMRLKAQSSGINEEEFEELENIVDTAMEIAESINRVRSKVSLIDDSELLESKETEDQASDEEDDNYSTKFIEAYNKHKARLGLKTQDDVAAITGLDRRYISNIERQKYRPQFKTIKRIADAFGADINEFM